jgi:hypothetical protein
VAQSEVDTKIDTEIQEKKDSKAQSVADYLQAPRRKRRSYVITALGGRTLEFQPGIDGFVKSQFKNSSIAHMRSVDDLMRSFKRQVLLLIFDDEFVGLEESLQHKIWPSPHHESYPCRFDVSVSKTQSPLPGESGPQVLSAH